MPTYNKYDSRRWKAAWYLTFFTTALLVSGFIDQTNYVALYMMNWGAWFGSMTVQKSKWGLPVWEGVGNAEDKQS